MGVLLDQSRGLSEKVLSTGAPVRSRPCNTLHQRQLVVVIQEWPEEWIGRKDFVDALKFTEELIELLPDPCPENSRTASTALSPVLPLGWADTSAAPAPSSRRTGPLERRGLR